MLPNKLLLASLCFLMYGFFCLNTFAGEQNLAEQKTTIEKIIHDYLISNPEVISEAISELNKRQKESADAAAQKVIVEQSAKIFNSPNQAVVGNPNGDITLVEFFDYNCGYCKKSLETVTQLIDKDPKLRVVLKDFPVLGTDSQEAAKVATAARLQLSPQKFWEFHRSLLSTRGHIGKEQALASAKAAGANIAVLERAISSPDIEASLGEVLTLAQALNFQGTPAWVIGSKTLDGAQPLEEFKSKIANMRKCGKAECQ